MIIGLALISKDEEQNLPQLLASCDGAFDRVVLVDTGSTDSTVDVFRGWCEVQQAQNPQFTWEVGSFEWCDDFAAARTAADDLLGPVDFKVWADCDDIIRGARNIRAACEQCPPHLVGFVAGYDYAQAPDGSCVCYLKRERILRGGTSRWYGRVHEAQLPSGEVQELDPSVVEWVHRKPPMTEPSERNLKILRSWLKDEPDNPRVLGYIGTEEASRGNVKEAVPFFRKYLALPTQWDQERAQVRRKLAQCLMSLNEFAEAHEVAFEALKDVPEWPDNCLSLAESYYHLGQLQKAIFWAESALRLGPPETLLIVNPMDYVVQPHVVLAMAYGAMGRFETAVEHADRVLAVMPHEMITEQSLPWRVEIKRDRTAKTWLAGAQLLIQHDEQLKALDHLETAPHFAREHPEVVALRSMLRERLAEHSAEAHYGSTPTKPERFLADDMVTEFCQRLPRAGFLDRHVGELVGSIVETESLSV